MNFSDMPKLPDGWSWKLFSTGKILLKKDNKVVGRAHILDMDQPALYILKLEVVAKYKRMGYGTVILDSIVQIARESNYESVSLYVHTTNSDAIAFYRKMKFFIALTYKDHYLMVTQLK